MQSEEIIVADSSPLIGLAQTGQLSVLAKLAAQVLVPRAVHVEVTSIRSDAPGAAEIAAQPWIRIVDADAQIVRPLLVFLGQGESEALALAQQTPSSVLLIDDLRARKFADRLGLRRMGTVALLARAKRAGLIPELKPALDALVKNGIFIRHELITAALREVGE